MHLSFQIHESTGVGISSSHTIPCFLGDTGEDRETSMLQDGGEFENVKNKTKEFTKHDKLQLEQSNISSQPLGSR